MRTPSMLRSLAVRLALWAALLVAVTPHVAAADPAADARSRELYKKGENAFAMGNYDQAAADFQAAYELSQRPRLLWNLAAAHKRWFEIDPDVTHLRRARAVYENYATVIGDPREEQEARREIAGLDGRIAIATGAARPSPLPPPAAKPLIASATVAKPPAAREPAKPVIAPIPFEPAPPPAPAASQPVYKKWWLWTTVGGVALVGGGVGVGLALGLRRDAALPDGLNAGHYMPVWP